MRQPKLKLDLRRPVTGAQFIDAHERWCATLSPNNARKHRSVFTRTLERAAHCCGEALRTLDVRPLILDLPSHARHIGSRRSAAENAATVRRSLEGITGYSRKGLERVAVPLRPPAYDPLFAHTDKQRAAAITRVARAAAMAGYQPDDHMNIDRLAAAATELGFERHFEHDCSAYRGAWRRLRDADPGSAARFGYISQKVREGYIGLRSLPDLAGRLLAAGCTEHPDLVSDLEIVRYLAPAQYDQLTYYLANGVTRPVEGGSKRRGRRKLSPHTRIDRVNAAIQLIALWERYGDSAKLRTATLADYLTIDQPDLFAGQAQGVSAGNPFARHNPELLQTGKSTVPLVIHLLDLSIRDRLKVAYYGDGATDDLNLRYTPSMRDDLKSVWAVLAPLQDVADETAYAKLQVSYNAALNHIDKHLIPESATKFAKDKIKAIQTVTYDQAICLILPAMARVVCKAKAAYQLACAEATRVEAPLDGVVCAEARKAWHDATLRYLLLAVVLADTKRIQQYMNGALGRHWRVEWREDSTPEQRRLASVTACWTRDEADAAHLKDIDGVGKPATRETVLSPAIVDYEIFCDWITDLRVDDLVAAKLVPSRAAYDLDRDLRTGQWALFPSPLSAASDLRRSGRMRRSDHRAPNPHRARTNLDTVLGRVIYEGCRDYLGRELPPWSERVARGYKGVFAPHIIRLWAATSIGGTYQMWATAERMTDDLMTTLKAEYLAVSEALRRSSAAWDQDGALGFLLLPMLPFDAHAKPQSPIATDPLAVLYERDVAREPGEPAWLPAPLRTLMDAEVASKRPTPRRQRRKLGPHLRRRRPEQSARLRAAKGDLRRLAE